MQLLFTRIKNAFMLIHNVSQLKIPLRKEKEFLDSLCWFVNVHLEIHIKSKLSVVRN